MSIQMHKIRDLFLVTDFVANGSFASLRENVTYLDKPDHAILIRLTDYTNNWNGNYIFVSEATFKFLSKSTVLPGDLIISNVGEPGKAFIVPDLGRPMTLGPNSILVRPVSSTVDTLFFYYLIKSPAGQSQIKKISSATNLKKFNKTDFRDISIPLPPLPDQIRIATLLSKAEALIAQRKESIRLLDELMKSTFLEMFGDPVKNEKGWKTVALETICKFENGDRSSNYPNQTDLVDEGVLFINSANIVNFRFSPANPNFITQEKYQSLSSGKCKQGDIIFTLRGNGLGKCCVFDGIYKEGFINAQLVIIRLNRSAINYGSIRESSCWVKLA